MSTQSLWGDLKGLDTVRTPAIILQEQAGLLGQLTNEVLEGEVTRRVSDSSQRIIVSLYIIAPALQRYRVKILEVEYGFAQMYPATVESSVVLRQRVAVSESALDEILGEILSSHAVRNVISSLIAESKMSDLN